MLLHSCYLDVSHTKDLVQVVIVFLYFIFTGCTGAMAYEFTKAHPELSVIVFDLPEVIEMRSCFQSKEQDSRVSFVAGQCTCAYPKYFTPIRHCVF